MIWLASYPRSGNTYFRIILDNIYGLRSSEYKDIYDMFRHIPRSKTPVIKTHLRPNYIFPRSKRIPAIYILRDGRDAMISYAHYMMNYKFSAPDYLENLHKLIVAGNGKFIDRWNFSYNSSWSTHVKEWLKRANIVIRYEDLIKDPVESVEKIRPFFDLPEPNNKEIPIFEEMKLSTAERISNSVRIHLKHKKNRRENFFRRGIVGSWKDEMPDDLHKLYWEHHGDMMRNLGYTDGMIE